MFADPEALNPTIHHFLQHSEMDFSDVKLMFQVAALVGYTLGDPSVCCTQHLGTTHFQMMVCGEEFGPTLLLPVNALAAQVLYERLTGLNQDAQKFLWKTFAKICNEFSLWPCFTNPSKQKEGERPRKGSRSKRDPVKSRASTSHKFSVVDKDSTLHFLAALLPELCPIFSVSRMVEALKNMGLRAELQTAATKLFVDSKATLEARVEWIGRLGRCEEPFYLEAARLSWARLSGVSRSLALLSDALALRVAQGEGVDKGLEIIEQATQRGDWSCLPEMEVEALFGILLHSVGEKGGRLVWQENERLRGMIMTVLLAGQFPPHAFSEKVKRGILWLAMQLGKNDAPCQGLHLLQAATDNQWLGFDQERYIEVKAALVQRALAEGRWDFSDYLGDLTTPAIVDWATANWTVDERRGLLDAVLASVRVGRVLPPIVERMCKWFGAESALLVSSLEAMQGWEILFSRLTGASSWREWMENVLPRYLQGKPSEESWSLAARLLEDAIGKLGGEPSALLPFNATVLTQFFQDGVEWNLVHGVLLAQRVERLSLCSRVDWKLVLRGQTPPWCHLQDTERGLCQQIINYWIDTDEVKLAESWLLSSGDLTALGPLYEKLLIKQLELGEGYLIVQKTLVAFDQKVFTTSQRQNIWERALKRFLQYYQEDDLVKSLELYKPYLSEDPTVRYRLSTLLKMVSQPNVLHVDLFLELMTMAPHSISCDLDPWKQFIFAAVKKKQIELGWKVFCQAPAALVAAVNGNSLWVRFFCGLAVCRPRDLLNMATDTKWKQWFSERHFTPYGRQILLYVECCRYLSLRKDDRAEALKSLKTRLDRILKMHSKTKQQQEMVQAAQTLIRAFVAREDAMGIVNAMEMTGVMLGSFLQEAKKQDIVAKQCGDLLVSAATIHAGIDSPQARREVELATLRFLELCENHHLPGFSRGRIATLFPDFQIPLERRSQITRPVKVLPMTEIAVLQRRIMPTFSPRHHGRRTSRVFQQITGCSLIIAGAGFLALLVSSASRAVFRDPTGFTSCQCVG